jgi:hypothetical protein
MKRHIVTLLILIAVTTMPSAAAVIGVPVSGERILPSTAPPDPLSGIPLSRATPEVRDWRERPVPTESAHFRAYWLAEQLCRCKFTPGVRLVGTPPPPPPPPPADDPLPIAPQPLEDLVGRNIQMSVIDGGVTRLIDTKLILVAPKGWILVEISGQRWWWNMHWIRYVRPR